MKQFSFRLPFDVYRDYAVIAEARGVDLTAILNWILAEYRPTLLLRHAQYLASMTRAAAAGLPQCAPLAPNNQEEVAKAKELLAQVQEMASTLAAQTDGERKQEVG